MKARVKTHVNVRAGVPEILPDNKTGFYNPNDVIEIADSVIGQEYKGNNIWYKLENGTFVWSGAIDNHESIHAVSEFNKNKYWWIADYGIDQLWSMGYTGKGIKIAVLDSGIDLPHPDLIINASNCIDKSGSQLPGIHDLTGHGTHVTGIISATNNGFGVKGIAYESDIYFCKTRNDEFADDLSLLVSALEWAIEKKVHIISISQGDSFEAPELLPLIKRAVNANILVVCAGGNSNIPTTDLLYPAKYPECIAVGAVDRNKKPVLNTIASKSLTIAAPGDNILSTFKGRGYKNLSGSSQATPFVSAVIALILQKSPPVNENYTTYIKNLFLNFSDRPHGLDFNVINPLKIFNNLQNQIS